jgi:hypothetical protein
MYLENSRFSMLFISSQEADVEMTFAGKVSAGDMPMC